MIEIEILGLGAWGRHFGSWSELSRGLNSGEWPDSSPLAPGLLPPAIRRRAPMSVKMAIEVMQQACTMANLEPAQLATVYSSSMGDMELTDRICRTLSEDPKLTSPTHFHNSVHNAATGYWTMATTVRRPATAISAFGHSTAISLLEAASQTVFEETPVLLVSGEVQAPMTLQFACPTQSPFAAALILAPPDSNAMPFANLNICLEDGEADTIRVKGLPNRLGEVPDACLLSALAALSSLDSDNRSTILRYAVSKSMHLRAEFSLPETENKPRA